MSIEPQELFTKIAKLRPEEFIISQLTITDLYETEDGIILLNPSFRPTVSSMLRIVNILKRGVFVYPATEGYRCFLDNLHVMITDTKGNVLLTFLTRDIDQHSAYYAGLEKIVELLEEQKK